MNIHEYQAKRILKEEGIPIPRGDVASTPERAKEIAEKLSAEKYAVKVQIHAGGRGKAGGIKVVSSAEEVYEVAKELLGKEIKTYQTGERGIKVKKVLVEEGVKIKKEFYLGLILNRSNGKISVIASTEGGVEIESIPQEKMLVEDFDIFVFQDWKARKIEKFLGIPVKEIVRKIYNIYIKYDCSLLEINPLALLEDGRVLALDTKMVFDDNALFRHKDIEKLYDRSQEDRRDAKAREVGVSYVGLYGNIGCLVNGAGLAMATMDEILLAGGSPANFLDVGGGASLEQVRSAFKILTSDKNVKAIFVNIFGGIMRCDTVATALVEVVKEMNIKLPIVVRLEGTNLEIGKRILEEANLPNIFFVGSIREGAELATQKAKEEEEKGVKKKKRVEKI